MHTATALNIAAIVMSVLSIIIALADYRRCRQVLKRAERSYRASNELRHNLARGAWEWPNINDPKGDK